MRIKSISLRALQRAKLYRECPNVKVRTLALGHFLAGTIANPVIRREENPNTSYTYRDQTHT